MDQGSSQHWTQTLYEATGETKLNGDALREYFRPLEDWLRSENIRTNEFIGWIYGNYCTNLILVFVSQSAISFGDCEIDF